jgi:hypothetical protein
MTHDDKRHGATPYSPRSMCSKAGVIAQGMRRHRHQEFIGFLNKLNRETPAGRERHLIVANYATHKHPKRCYGASGEGMAPSSLQTKPTGCPMPQVNDLSRCLTALDQDSTMIAVIEMSQSSWLVAGIVPGIERHPAKKLEPDAAMLLRVLQRWRAEAERSGRQINRIAVAFEAVRDGVWLAPHGSSRWAEGARLRARAVEAEVIHPNSIAVSREHRRAKTDRLDTALLKRSFLGCPSTSSGAWRTRPLPDDRNPEPGRGGRQAAGARA